MGRGGGNGVNVAAAMEGDHVSLYIYTFYCLSIIFVGRGDRALAVTKEAVIATARRRMGQRQRHVRR